MRKREKVSKNKLPASIMLQNQCTMTLPSSLVNQACLCLTCQLLDFHTFKNHFWRHKDICTSESHSQILLLNVYDCHLSSHKQLLLWSTYHVVGTVLSTLHDYFNSPKSLWVGFYYFNLQVRTARESIAGKWQNQWTGNGSIWSDSRSQCYASLG